MRAPSLFTSSPADTFAVRPSARPAARTPEKRKLLCFGQHVAVGAFRASLAGCTKAMKRLKLWTWLMLVALWVEPAPARPDVIFKVPEVLVRHAAAPRPVGTGPTPNATRSNTSELWSEDGHELLQERFEYFVEHEVSTADAKKAAQILRLVAVPDAPPGCGKCTKRELEYCETKVMADHCCCERRFLPEPFPWLPHTCYIGPERCTPIAHNCARYTRLRDCCCYKKLAERWKGILSRGSQLSISGLALLLFSLILFTLYL